MWKMIMYLFLSILISSSVIGCATNPVNNKYYNLYRGKIKEISFAPICSHINLVSNSGETFDVETTAKCETIINESIGDVMKGRATVINTTIDKTMPKYENELAYLFINLKKNNDYSVVKRIPDFIGYINEHPERYYVFTYCIGYTRTAKKNAESLGTSIVVAIATLGFYAPVESQSVCGMYMCIVDKEKQEVIYFDYRFEEGNPTKKGVVNKVLRSVFRYF